MLTEAENRIKEFEKQEVELKSLRSEKEKLEAESGALKAEAQKTLEDVEKVSSWFVLCLEKSNFKRKVAGVRIL